MGYAAKNKYEELYEAGSQTRRGFGSSHQYNKLNPNARKAVEGPTKAHKGGKVDVYLHATGKTVTLDVPKQAMQLSLGEKKRAAVQQAFSRKTLDKDALPEASVKNEVMHKPAHNVSGMVLNVRHAIISGEQNNATIIASHGVSAKNATFNHTVAMATPAFSAVNTVLGAKPISAAPMTTKANASTLSVQTASLAKMAHATGDNKIAAPEAPQLVIRQRKPLELAA